MSPADIVIVVVVVLISALIIFYGLDGKRVRVVVARTQKDVTPIALRLNQKKKTKKPV